jgi:23S rRNA pseudouridine1911/1915/1917 synthase
MPCYFCIMSENPDFASETLDDLYERKQLVVDKGQALLRIDKFLMTRIEGGTRNKLQRALYTGMVKVNGQIVKPNYRVRPGDEIIMYSDTEAESTDTKPENIPLDIVYEDDHVLVINKKPGMVVHPGSGNYSGTLINGVAWHLQQQNPDLNEDILPRFGLVHRIDKNTSGLLVLAKTDRAMESLAKQFFDHTIERRYMALAWGDFANDQGTIVAHVGRHQRFRKLFEAYPDGEHGKEAITHYTVLERMHYVTLLECVLETGRTHQIRVHMKYLGHPLFSDETYGGNEIVKGTVYSKYKQFVENCFAICPRQALHARTLGFVHPATREKMLFECPLPADFQALINKWRKYVSALKKRDGSIADEEQEETAE